jgi:hypothetical protein
MIADQCLDSDSALPAHKAGALTFEGTLLEAFRTDSGDTSLDVGMIVTCNSHYDKGYEHVYCTECVTPSYKT